MERLFLSDKDSILPFENQLVTVRLSDGRTWDGLQPRRLFPISAPSTYITLLDEQGQEMCVVRALTDLNEDSRHTVEDSLADYYLVPRILRIVQAVEKYGTLRFTVETDRGRKRFDIRNRNHDIRVSPDGYVRIRDADDNRYVIEDYRTLDRQSRAALIADL
ncbi:MAG: DUF1854 domain-containing protein [Clostridia bacterium]|nr:DUF1854 domain-containing protein [Clostridia bacterium]